MGKQAWDLLFSKYDLRAVLENQLKQVDGKVIALNKGSFDTDSDELLAARVASDLLVAPLELVEDEISVSSDDVRIDARNLRDRDLYLSDWSQPYYVDGVRVTYHLPFRGDRELLFCHPNTYTLNPPRAVVERGELRFPYERTDRNITATKSEFEKDLKLLGQWIPWINEQVQAFNTSLEEHVRTRVVSRRGELAKTREDLSALGFKVRTPGAGRAAVDPTSQPASRANRRTQRRERAQRAYDVALSFAGEDRSYVDRVAARLTELGVAVFYDDFEKVNLWGKDLAEHFGDVYGKTARFVVLFISRYYAAKAWPNHEKQFALGRRLAGEAERILPVKFDDTALSGLPPTIGYLDLRVLTPEKLAELIRQKIDDERLDSGE